MLQARIRTDALAMEVELAEFCALQAGLCGIMTTTWQLEPRQRVTASDSCTSAPSTLAACMWRKARSCGMWPGMHKGPASLHRGIVDMPALAHMCHAALCCAVAAACLQCEYCAYVHAGNGRCPCLLGTPRM